MRILLVTESYWPNPDGGAFFERRLVQSLIGRGHELTVWAPSKTGPPQIEKDGKSTIYRARSIPFIFNLNYRTSLWPWPKAQALLSSIKPDIIHIHNPGFLGRSALRWARRHNVPVLATNHLMPENILMNLPLRVLNNTYANLIWRHLVRFHNKASYVTAPTPTAIRYLEKYGLTTPHQAISNGIDTHQFRPRLSPAPAETAYRLSDTPRVLYLGRCDGEKRVDLLIDAFAIVRQTTPAQLIIAGPGKELDELKNQVKALGLTHDVTFTGFVDESLKPNLYAAADVFAISSPAELQSIVTLEAMATALPIVAVDVAALSELVRPGSNGFLFKAGDTNDCAQALIKLLESRPLRVKMGTVSRQHVMRHHSNTATIDQYEAVYRRLLVRQP